MRRAALGPVLLSLALAWGGVARADLYRLLEEHEDAAEVRVDLIRTARTTVDATYFIVGKDQVAHSFLAELRDASRRGVRVRLLIDAPFNAVPKPVQASMIGEGVEIKEYHPFRITKPGWFARRLHDKLLITDGVHLVTGGRNLEASYFGFAAEESGREYLDRDAYVRGASARHAQEYFDRVWDSREVRATSLGRFDPDALARASPRRRARLAARIEAASRLLELHEDVLEDHGLADGAAPRRVPEAREVGPVRFLHDPVGRKDGDEGMAPELFGLVEQARERVTLESPWLVPSRALRLAFDRALARGVRVRVLTNSLAVTDTLLTHAGYAMRRKRLARRGVELWEYAGPECLHSKTGVFDDHTVVIGSFNLDPRSEHLNSEVAVVIRDATAAAEALRPMDARLGSAVRIGPDGKPVEGAVQLPEVPWKRRLLFLLARVIAPFVHRQL